MYTFGSSLLALQVQDAAPPAGSGGMLQILADSSPLSQVVLAILIAFSVASWAIILFKTLSYRAVRAADCDVSRRVSQEPEVFGRAGGLSVPARQSSGRGLPGGLRGDHRPVPRDRPGRESGGRLASSNAQEP